MGLFKSFNKYKENIAIIDKKYSNLSYKQVLTETNEIKKKVKKFLNRLCFICLASLATTLITSCDPGSAL